LIEKKAVGLILVMGLDTIEDDNALMNSLLDDDYQEEVKR
jgi:hypothetical protein